MKNWVVTYTGGTSHMREMKNFFVEKDPIIAAENDIENPKEENPENLIVYE